MRLLHTSDWHAGRVLFRQSLIEDLKHSLSQMLNIIKEKQVELVLVCGDIFDSYNAPTEAQDVVYKFFLELYKLNIKAIVICGNHDSSNVLRSIKGLLNLANVIVFEKPAIDNLISFQLNGSDINIAALPYPSERAISTLLNYSESYGKQLMNYCETVTTILSDLDKGFPSKGINIICAHLMVSGASYTGTEREASLADMFSITPQSFPLSANYIALGHVHRAQEIKKSPVKTYYSGSPIQMDFGESKDIKGVYIVDLEEGSIAKNEFVELIPLNPLKYIEVKKDELNTVFEEYKDFKGYLKIKVEVEGKEPGLSDEIRKELGNERVLFVQLENKNKQQILQRSSISLIDPIEVYRSYYKYKGLNLSDEIEKAYLEILQEVEL